MKYFRCGKIKKFFLHPVADVEFSEERKSTQFPKLIYNDLSSERRSSYSQRAPENTSVLKRVILNCFL
jgi:hypothetical protein